MLRDEVNILVVDDVNSMRVQIKEVLKGVGFRKVTVASSGEEAKTILDLAAFHLILADWHMAPTDGIQLLKAIRVHENIRIQKIPFIMVTAECTREKVIDATLLLLRIAAAILFIQVGGLKIFGWFGGMPFSNLRPFMAHQSL